MTGILATISSTHAALGPIPLGAMWCGDGTGGGCRNGLPPPSGGGASWIPTITWPRSGHSLAGLVAGGRVGHVKPDKHMADVSSNYRSTCSP